MGHIRRMFSRAVEAFIRAQRRRAQRAILQRLDERTLRDIGLDAEANRARERLRQAAFRLATY